MKRIYTTLIALSFLMAPLLNAQERYLDEVFTETELTANVIYGQNLTILPLLAMQAPAVRPLNLNLVTPTGDTETNRPLIILLHTGNFLPALLNGGIHGDVDDPYLVSLAERLGRMGYVVALADYRKGWNPIATSQEERTNTLINAAYRGVQDINACTRFFRRSVMDGGNPYGINPEQIVVWGVGTGGYAALGAAALDQYEDVLLDKFFGPDINGDGFPDPFVIEPFHGDPLNTQVGIDPFMTVGVDTLSYPNHADECEEDGVNCRYSSEIQLVVNMGGAMGDISWYDESDPPTISYHVPTDPLAPYMSDILIVPTTGDLVVQVDGSFNVNQQSNALGNNDIFKENVVFDDPYTEAANASNNGLEGLFPFNRPNWDLTVGPFDDGIDNPVPVEASPWEYWDTAKWSTAPFGQATLADAEDDPCFGIPIEQCNWDLITRRSNPDGSIEKATAYQDSILGYFGPRACVALDLPCAQNFLIGDSTEDILSAGLVSASPNPTSNDLVINSTEFNIKSVQLVDMSGKLALSIKGLDTRNYTVNRAGIESGMYILQVRFEDGLVSQKVVFK